MKQETEHVAVLFRLMHWTPGICSIIKDIQWEMYSDFKGFIPGCLGDHWTSSKEDYAVQCCEINL